MILILHLRFLICLRNPYWVHSISISSSTRCLNCDWNKHLNSSCVINSLGWAICSWDIILIMSSFNCDDSWCLVSSWMGRPQFSHLSFASNVSLRFKCSHMLHKIWWRTIYSVTLTCLSFSESRLLHSFGRVGIIGESKVRSLLVMERWLRDPFEKGENKESGIFLQFFISRCCTDVISYWVLSLMLLKLVSVRSTLVIFRLDYCEVISSTFYGSEIITLSSEMYYGACTQNNSKLSRCISSRTGWFKINS